MTDLIIAIAIALIVGAILAIVVMRLAAKKPGIVAEVVDDIYIEGAKAFAALWAMHAESEQAVVAAAEANVTAVKALSAKRRAALQAAAASASVSLAPPVAPPTA